MRIRAAAKSKSVDAGLQPKQYRQPTYYELLGCSPGVDAKVLHEAFRLRTTQWHPDKGTDQRDINRRNNIFASITAAYGVLKHAATRKQYDATLRLQGGLCGTCAGAGQRLVQLGVTKRAMADCSACNATGQADGGLPPEQVYKG